MRKTKTTNPELLGIIDFLKKQSRETGAGIWRDIAERLTKPRSKSTAVNISRLNRHTRKSDTVVVAGKVLGTGTMNHAVTVAAFGFSAAARLRIEAAKGKCVSLTDLAKKNPKGTDVKIIG